MFKFKHYFFLIIIMCIFVANVFVYELKRTNTYNYWLKKNTYKY